LESGRRKSPGKGVEKRGGSTPCLRICPAWPEKEWIDIPSRRSREKNMRRYGDRLSLLPLLKDSTQGSAWREGRDRLAIPSNKRHKKREPAITRDASKGSRNKKRPRGQNAWSEGRGGINLRPEEKKMGASLFGSLLKPQAEREKRNKTPEMGGGKKR